MRFALQNQFSNNGRLGIISNISRLQDFQMETPHVLLYTKCGTVPHLTHEVLQLVSQEKLGLDIPIQSVEFLQDQMKLFKHSIADFIGMKEYLTYISHINSIEENPPGPRKKEQVGLWSRNGRKYFSAESYMSMIEHFKPDMFVLLADGETDSESSQSRVNNSYKNSTAFYDQCMEIYEKSNELKSTKILRAIEGGFNLTLREESSKAANESPVFGVVIDGIHNNHATVSDISHVDIKPVVEASLKFISEDKLRIIHGCWNPSVILDLIEMGVDLFDTAYPTSVTEQYGAFIFPNTESWVQEYQLSKANDQRLIKTVGNSLKEDEVELKEPVSKKSKVSNSKYFTSMLDPSLVTDFNPICKNCTCLTCKNHTKAYIHHLVSVKELLGSTLLMIHNLHHFLLFFSTIRKAIKSSKFQDFKKSFQTCFDN